MKIHGRNELISELMTKEIFNLREEIHQVSNERRIRRNALFPLIRFIQTLGKEKQLRCYLEERLEERLNTSRDRVIEDPEALLLLLELLPEKSKEEKS